MLNFEDIKRALEAIVRRRFATRLTTLAVRIKGGALPPSSARLLSACRKAATTGAESYRWSRPSVELSSPARSVHTPPPQYPEDPGCEHQHPMVKSTNSTREALLTELRLCIQGKGRIEDLQVLK